MLTCTNEKNVLFQINAFPKDERVWRINTCIHLYVFQRIAEQVSRTRLRNQRCAGSASNRGCQSNETVTSSAGIGRAKLYIPARRFPVCRSGTLAIRSEARARVSAVEKLPTIVTISRSSPNDFKASSIGSLSEPCRETQMCFPLA